LRFLRVVPQGDAPACVKSGLHVTIAVDNGGGAFAGGAWAVRMGFLPQTASSRAVPAFFVSMLLSRRNAGVPGRSASFFFHH
jgi:hypothetical protein